MDQDPDSDDDEMEVFKLAALADDEREAQADAETRANEEAAAQDEANAEATAQAAQLYSLGLSDEEANAIMPKGKRPADSSGSSDDSSGSSDDGSCHGGGGGRKKKKRRQHKKMKGGDYQATQPLRDTPVCPLPRASPFCSFVARAHVPQALAPALY